MQGICKEYVKICIKYAQNKQIKYAKICKNVQHIFSQRNMQKYAKICKNMHAICKNMQNMQSRFLYAKYAKICTPHFADGGPGAAADDPRGRSPAAGLGPGSALGSELQV